MTVNNPFIRYKIYTTSGEKFSNSGRLLANVTVACVIFANETENQSFLKQILTAVKLTNSDYQIIVVDKDQFISAADLKWFDQLKYILYFGVSPSSTDIHIPSRIYGNTKLRHTTIIQLPTLKKIESSQTEKQRLWQLLKKEFLHD